MKPAAGFFELKKTAELAPTFTRVAQELHSLYALGLRPPIWTARSTSSKVRAKAGMMARARKTYIAHAKRSPERIEPCSRSRISVCRPTTRSRICSARCCLSLTTKDSKVELQNGVLQVVFDEPSPAKFVVSPNAPVRQIWVSAMSRSYKLSWSPDRSAFELDGESLIGLVTRLTESFLKLRRR
jgi:frataxin-like iron-binding protein CyaY